MVATAPSSIGAPLAAGRQRTPPNLSEALTANCVQSWRWSCARTLTHNAPMSRIVGQDFDVRAGQNEMYGGSSDTDVTDWHVKPYGRTPSLAVITATPVQNRPRTSRIDAGMGGALVVTAQASAAALARRNTVSRPVVSGRLRLNQRLNHRRGRT